MRESGPTGNRLLDALPGSVRLDVLDQAQLVRLSLRQLLFRQDEPIERVYFPTTAVLSLVTLLQDGSMIELAVIGNEGMTGTPVLLGADAMANAHCICQIVGEAVSMPTASFRHQLDEHPDLREVCNRYIGVLLTELSQGVACSRMHTTTQRCARWLLMTHDRVRADRFHLTHEFLGFMLGSRRASVSESLSRLSTDGLISSRHGDINILDRFGLEREACECYDVIRKAVASVAA